MVVDDHDTVDPAALPILSDIGKVTGISLPDLAEFVLFVGFTAAEVWVTGRFQVVVADETLDGIHTDFSRDKRFPYQMFIDLGGVHSWMFQLDAVDLCNGFVIQGTGAALVSTDIWHQGVKAAKFILGLPFFKFYNCK